MEIKKPGSYLLSHLISSIIGVRELDFRVRDGNGYCLSTMATGRYKLVKKNAQGERGRGARKRTDGRKIIWSSRTTY